MSFINWSESFSIGIDEIDQQHRSLFALINKLYSAMKRGEGKDITEEIINELSNYALLHFKTEEEYLLKESLPFKDSHINAHRMFTDKVQSFYKMIHDEEGNVTKKLLSFLREWIINHIEKVDQQSFQNFKQNDSFL